jgi:PTS system cellobiose-specific IIA component
MNETNAREEMLQTAMKIIINAGDARNLIKEALDAIVAQQFDLAGKKMEQAKDFIRIAHESQTEMIQSEARGEKMEYSLLFSHAQDTLMTISSEYNIAGQMMKIFLSLSERIHNLE